jgi:hypothetical protein
MTSTRIVISVGIGGSGDRYEKYLRRLKRTVEDNWSGSTLFYEGVYPAGSPTHEEINYGFKAYALQEAVRQGYTCLLWSDACVIARAPLEPLFNHIEKEGYVLIGDSHRVRDWTSDKILAWAGIDRTTIPDTALCVAGGFVGIDITHPMGKLIYDRWIDAVEKRLTSVLWSNDPIGDRCRSVSFHTGEFISEDPTVQGSMSDEAVLGTLAFKHVLVTQPGDNPWCSQHWNGVFQSTGYDGGEYGALE